MTPLPPGWAPEVLAHALDGARFRARFDREPAHGAVFPYGAPGEPPLVVTAVVGPGALRFVARRAAPAFEADEAWLRRANDVTLDWGFGRLAWNARARCAELSTTLFAYPDRVPPAAEVHAACHGLWGARHLLDDPSATPPGYADPSDLRGPAAFAARFAAAGRPLAPRDDGSFVQRFDTGDPGSFVLRLVMERPGLLVLDGLPVHCPEWPDRPGVWEDLHALTTRLLGVAATRWTRRMVVRMAVPTSWIPEHPAWVPLVLDQLSWAALDVARIGAGGPIERPG